MKRRHKFFTYCMIGTLSLVGGTATAKAEEIPIAGINLSLEDFFQSEYDTLDIKKILTSNSEELAFAKVSSYVNIRSTGSEEGEILGKLYNNSAATILEKSGEWYKVKSGNVTGYIKAEFLVTGIEAEQLANEVQTRIAKVTTTTLKVREKASTDATILTLVANGDELVVKKELDGWVKVELEESKEGYLSAEYVELKSAFEEAVSIEEEQERLAEEQAALASEQQRAATGQSQNTNSSNQAKSSNSSNKSINAENTSTSSIRSKIVAYARSFEGNPYVWGGTSLTNGADCSGFTQSVFRDNGISIPRTSRTQAVGGRRISVDSMQPGDLIFYARNGTINHVGIYIGNGKVISASSPETGIRITSYNYRTPVKVVSYINN